MSGPSLKRLEVSSVNVAFGDFIEDRDYVEAHESAVKRGYTMYQYGTPVHSASAGAIARAPEELADMAGIKRGVVVDNERAYLAAAGSEYVDFIAFGRDGPSRVSFIRELVRSGKFCPKPHWLWGLPNPAELSVYRHLFSGYVQSTFEVAVCESCFQYSMYGARFSRSRGVLAQIPHEIDGILGMGEWWRYQPCVEQYRVFYSNQDIVDRFSRGDSAPEYEEKLYAILEEIDEEKKEGVL